MMHFQICLHPFQIGKPFISPKGQPGRQNDNISGCFCTIQKTLHPESFEIIIQSFCNWLIPTAVCCPFEFTIASQVSYI